MRLSASYSASAADDSSYVRIEEGRRFRKKVSRLERVRGSLSLSLSQSVAAAAAITAHTWLGSDNLGTDLQYLFINCINWLRGWKLGHMNELHN
jgi:hypothetical protein